MTLSSTSLTLSKVRTHTHTQVRRKFMGFLWSAKCAIQGNVSFERKELETLYRAAEMPFRNTDLFIAAGNGYTYRAANMCSHAGSVKYVSV